MIYFSVCFAAGRFFRCSAGASASALTHFVRSLALAASGAAPHANRFITFYLTEENTLHSNIECIFFVAQIAMSI